MRTHFILCVLQCRQRGTLVHISEENRCYGFSMLHQSDSNLLCYIHLTLSSGLFIISPRMVYVGLNSVTTEAYHLHCRNFIFFVTNENYL